MSDYEAYLKDEINKYIELANGSKGKRRSEFLGQCARISKELADNTSNEELRRLRLQNAKKFEEAAGEILLPPPPPDPTEQPPIEQPGNKQPVKTAKSLVLVEKPNIKFEDIAGLEKVKENIKEAIVYPFKHADDYEWYKVKPGGGILLYGPPGCGKTMLAAAAAAECDAVFINLKISDIKDKYVGESEKKIKEVFNLARSYEKAILFFDEIDALAGERSGSMEGHERSLVNELLSQMDGIEAKGNDKRYLVLAATNRPWDVDIALRRPGRFDTSVFIPNPDLAARKKIFELSLKGRPCKVDASKLAQMTDGYASAEIVEICDKAAMIPLREKIKGKSRREITFNDFESAISESKSVLSSWYPKAIRELSNTEEVEIFKDLIEAGKRYLVDIPITEKVEKEKINVNLSAEIEKIIAGTDIKPPVLESTFKIAYEISREGREGKPIGTSFVIGDSKNVLARSRQLVPNPLGGVQPSEKMITDPEFNGTIKEFAQNDGAFVISDDGVVEAACRQLTADATNVNIPRGHGTRHSSMAAMTMATKSVGIVVSQSGGKITIIKDGGFVKSFSP